jgi:hypothetical protein
VTSASGLKYNGIPIYKYGVTITGKEDPAIKALMYLLFMHCDYNTD